MKRLSVLLITGLVILTCGSLLAFSDQITKVGIVDLFQVYSVFFRESKAVRDLEQLVSAFRDEVDKYRDEIHELELAKLATAETEDEKLLLELTQKIFEKELFLDDYIRINKEQLRIRQEKLAQSDEFYQQIYEVLEYIAEYEGFALVLSKSIDGILYYIKEIDMTEKVIDELRKRNSQTPQ